VEQIPLVKSEPLISIEKENHETKKKRQVSFNFNNNSQFSTQMPQPLPTKKQSVKPIVDENVNEFANESFGTD
jgi:hypothetical protein